MVARQPHITPAHLLPSLSPRSPPTPKALVHDMKDRTFCPQKIFAPFSESLSSLPSEKLSLRQPWAWLYFIHRTLPHKTVSFFKVRHAMCSSNDGLDKPDPSWRWNSCAKFYKDKISLCCSNEIAINVAFNNGIVARYKWIPNHWATDELSEFTFETIFIY